MYGVSNDVIEAWKTDGVHKEYRIVVNGTSYGNQYIVDDSFSLKQAILDSENFEAIGCIASSFSVELHAQFGTKIRDQRIKVYARAGNTTEIQVFDGYVNKCTKTANGWKRQIEAYDFLYTMSGQSGMADENEKKKYDVTQWFNEHADVTLSNLLTQLCSKFGLTVQTGNKPLCNGSFTTHCGRNHAATNLSALDLLKHIMHANGCFGYITGDGKFSWKYLVMPAYDDFGWLFPSAYLYPESTLYPGQDPNHEHTEENATNFIGEYETLEYQDFQMLPINVVRVRNFEKDENSGMYRGGNPSSDENVYIIQGNPLFQDATKEQKDGIAKNIYDVLSSTWYVPFTADLPGLPYLECGDEVNFYDFVGDYGSASLQRFYILSRTLSGGQHLKDNFEAQGNEYQHEFVSGSGDGDEGLRDELENNYDTSDEVDEKIENAAGLYNIVSVASYSDIPNPPASKTLYCVQGEIQVVDSLEPEDPEPEQYPEPDEPTGESGENST